MVELKFIFVFVFLFETKIYVELEIYFVISNKNYFVLNFNIFKNYLYKKIEYFKYYNFSGKQRKIRLLIFVLKIKILFKISTK